MKKETLKSAELQDSRFFFRVSYGDYPIPHSHDFWEFMLITDGLYNHKINGKSIAIKKNVLCLIRPDDRHSIVKMSEKVSHINFIVPDEIMHSQLEIIMQGEYEKLLKSDPLSFEISERALQMYLGICSRIKNRDSGSMTWHYAMSQMFLLFIHDLIVHCGSNFLPTDEDIPRLVRKIIDAINYSAESSRKLSEIIADFNYSYIHASRLFKTHMKMTLKKYYMKVKMEAAASLLESTSLSIIQVAEKLGYNNLSHFTIIFKEYFDISPAKYRKHWTEFYSGFEDA